MPLSIVASNLQVAGGAFESQHVQAVAQQLATAVGHIALDTPPSLVNPELAAFQIASADLGDDVVDLTSTRYTYGDVAIITFNYDLALDYALHFFTVPVDYCLGTAAAVKTRVKNCCRKSVITLDIAY